VNRLFTAEWCYTEFPWGEDKEMEQWLKDSSPFREVRHVVSPRRISTAALGKVDPGLLAKTRPVALHDGVA
jgi:hypothetical protein